MKWWYCHVIKAGFFEGFRGTLIICCLCRSDNSLLLTHNSSPQNVIMQPSCHIQEHKGPKLTRTKPRGLFQEMAPPLFSVLTVSSATSSYVTNGWTSSFSMVRENLDGSHRYPTSWYEHLTVTLVLMSWLSYHKIRTNQKAEKKTMFPPSWSKPLPAEKQEIRTKI